MASVGAAVNNEQVADKIVCTQKCHVRSGSCGSASTADSEGSERNTDMMRMAFSNDITYPLPVQVRNTFVDVLPDRSPSLDSHLQIRQTQSAPASGVAFASGETLLQHASDINGSVASLAAVTSKTGQDKSALLHHESLNMSSDFHIKNTFIHCVEARAPSFEEFYQERLVRSCPGSGVSPHSGACSCPASGISVVTANYDDEALMSAMAAVSLASPSLMGPPCGATFSAVRTDSHNTQQRMVLNLSESLVEPELGSEQFPSVGSKGHATGSCKPCAFALKGCASGKDCTFCHLCELGEKKRRKKEKKQVIREVDRWRKSVTDSWRHMSAAAW